MKVAVVTTSIYVPRVLELYSALDSTVRFFVAGDLKSPNKAVLEWMESRENVVWLPANVQKELKYKHSEMIGWNTDSRRNIAVLEALKWGADIIISIDDDMIPVSYDFFDVFRQTFLHPFSGLKLGAARHWFDAGAFTQPPARQRGLPIDVPFDSTPGFVVEARIGVAQGIILGVPDSDASTAIINQPFIHSATDILRHGFIVEPKAYAVFNSQITAFRRELALAFAQFYKWQGRNTDILASVLMRRIMRDLDLYTYFGPPAAYHARSKRPLFPDLQAEMHGLRTIHEMTDFCERMTSGPNVLTTCRFFYGGYAGLPSEMREAALAWCEDAESVL